MRARAAILLWLLAGVAGAQTTIRPGGGTSSGGGVTPATLKDATYCPDVGASDAYVCSMVSAPSSYEAGMLVTLSANTANTGTATVNVNSLGVKTIVRSDGTTLQTGDITAGMIVSLVYDGTNYFRAVFRSGTIISPAGGVTIRSDTYASGSDVGLTVQGSPSGNIMNLKNSGGTTLAAFNSGGNLKQSPGDAGLFLSNSGAAGLGDVTNNFPYLSVNIGSGVTQVSSYGIGFVNSANAFSGSVMTSLKSPSAGTLQVGLDVNGAAVNQTFKAHDGITGSNLAGAALTLSTGRGTGNATPADRIDQTAVPTASGETAQTLGDRVRVIGKYTDLTEATATAFARVAVASSTVAGGDVVVTVEANDATDFQARTLTVPWSASNKAGTLTLGLGTPSEAIAASAGTLTCTLTLVDSGSGKADFKADCTSSLHQTVLRANAQVRKNFGAGAISAQ